MAFFEDIKDMLCNAENTLHQRFSILENFVKPYHMKIYWTLGLFLLTNHRYIAVSQNLIFRARTVVLNL